MWRACGTVENVWQSKGYASLMMARTRLLLRLVSAGVPVWIQETDQVWFKNVRIELARFIQAAPGARNASILALDDGNYRTLTTSGTPTICMGFVVLQKGLWTVKILSMAMEAMEKIQNFDGDDQKIITETARGFSSQAGAAGLVQYLPRDVFASGLFLKKAARTFSYDLSIPDNMAMVHANWIVGMQSKLDALQRNNLLCSVEY